MVLSRGIVCLFYVQVCTGELAKEYQLMKKTVILFLAVIFVLSGCGQAQDPPALSENETWDNREKVETTLTYGSGDYTRINPAMDEHGEINILIFN